MECHPSDKGSDKEEVIEVAGLVTRWKILDLAKGKVPNWQDDLGDFKCVAIQLDAVNI
jgi:hypothetical protein